MRSRVRPASLALLQEEKGEDKMVESIVHHHLQTDATEHVVDVEAEHDLCHDNTDEPTKGSHDFCDATGPPDNVSIFRRFKEGLFSSKKSSSETGPVVSTYNVDAYPFSFCSVSSSAFEATPIASIQPCYTNIWSQGEVVPPDHTPPGSSCSLEAAMDIPGYIPVTTVHAAGK